MRALLESPWKALTAGGVLVVLLALLMARGIPDHTLVSAMVRWLHVLSGMVWVGLVWFVNFVQLVALQDADQAGRSAIFSHIAPRVAFWFRHAATGTVAAGLILAVLDGQIVSALTFGLFDGFHVRNIMLGIGIWLGVAMWVFVHFLIWPNLKIVLGLVEANAEGKDRARLKVRNYARKNLVLSIPVTFAMVTASHAG